jgi:S-adenosylmethionine decarboxylase
MEFNLVRKETAARAVQQQRQDEADENAWITERVGVRCAGVHMIVDLYGASRLDEPPLMEDTLRRCVQVAGATLLHIHLHRFEPNGGISGVAVLAESHISVHSWPERQYAALDIFMCGKARPERCIEVLLEAFSPRRAEIQELLRGRLE